MVSEKSRKFVNVLNETKECNQECHVCVPRLGENEYKLFKKLLFRNKVLITGWLKNESRSSRKCSQREIMEEYGSCLTINMAMLKHSAGLLLQRF